eukprot:CAMPEP_0178905124 /NCGR_PEP_ID=MMETSP0786-20121207/6085_1 /TAXON_ID=186022 /ORGANISM="Thalassionema frauenfeldii, Strain CCMP 1798" /LENGTH=365 /DNA_ID=CAMNT_0020576665 /DNA_START=237 /DNA_END=1332 /DNA_ORIENTATION=+
MASGYMQTESMFVDSVATWSINMEKPNPRFTGWTDVPLTVKGRVEAVGAGQLLRSRGFDAARVDVAFTSKLQRAHETCELVLASMAGPDQHTWSSERIRRLQGLNERHYGLVQGLYKNDVNLLKEYGAETVLSWRRSLRERPPPLDESHKQYLPPPAPTTESLFDCQNRVCQAYEEHIVPALFEESEGLQHPPNERTVLVVAHSNTLRSLMAYLDKVDDDLVPKLHVPNSVPILYFFDPSTRAIVSQRLSSSEGMSSHARWLVSAQNYREVRKVIEGHQLTRAIFNFFDDGEGDLELTAAEIDRGLREFIRFDEDIDCVTIAVAKKVAREMRPNESISREEYENRALAATVGLSSPDDDIEGIMD